MQLCTTSTVVHCYLGPTGQAAHKHVQERGCIEHMHDASGQTVACCCVQVSHTFHPMGQAAHSTSDLLFWYTQMSKCRIMYCVLPQSFKALLTTDRAMFRSKDGP